MSEHQSFLSPRQSLSFAEMERLCLFLIGAGVEHIRITGGEPLVRKGIDDFLIRLGAFVASGALKELTLTTNATRLKAFVPTLKAANIRRINVSLDSLKPDVFARITRGGKLETVLDGLDAAAEAGIHIKLNVVALARDNREELPDIIRFAHARGFGVSLIETMPLGDEIDGREDQFVSLTEVMSKLQSFWRFDELNEVTAGPARYVHIHETGGKLGLITPLSHNFCATCNRVRITCEGKLYMCLGQDDHVDLKAALRSDETDAALSAALAQALLHKPKSHDFFIGGKDLVRPERPFSPTRTMSVTGG
jgi:GTP 3',8-cyclase